jgi:hypothetical protein
MAADRRLLMFGYFSTNSSVVKLEAMCLSETLAVFFRTEKRYIMEHHTHQEK